MQKLQGQAVSAQGAIQGGQKAPERQAAAAAGIGSSSSSSSSRGAGSSYV
jgi:hypothetical protein